MSGLEKHAAGELAERYDLISYIPLIRTSRVIAGRVVPGAEPLFRRYVFLLNLTCQWRAVLETRGVMSFLFPGEDGPEFVRDSVVEEIRSREVDGFVPLPKKPEDPNQFYRDQRLVVREGLMAGKVVVHSGLTIGKREFCFLEMFGRQRIEFDHSNLEVAPKEQDQEKRRRRRKRGTRADRDKRASSFNQSNTPAFLARTTQSSSIPAA